MQSSHGKHDVVNNSKVRIESIPKWRNLTILSVCFLFLIASLQAQGIYPGKAAKIEENISAAFPYESQYLDIGNHKIHYVESGEGDPVLLLHGFPSSSYVWRNIINKIDKDKKVIALDFLGFGKSSFPEDRNVSPETQYQVLVDFIRVKELQNITLWVHDLGSIIGMMYATREPENVKGIGLFEAPMMPTAAFYKQLPFNLKLVMKLTRKPEKAEKLYVEKNFVGKKFPKVLTARKLSDKELTEYARPFEEKERRYAAINGPDPAQMSFNKGRGNTEFEMLINQLANDFKETDIPIVYFYAKPGFLNNKEAVLYARNTFKVYQEVYVGKGKHFLTESHPQKMSDAFNKWYKTLK
ncbi:MAG: alpha/beta fold hydrolase [Bacteroidota bacterium]